MYCQALTSLSGVLALARSQHVAGCLAARHVSQAQPECTQSCASIVLSSCSQRHNSLILERQVSALERGPPDGREGAAWTASSLAADPANIGAFVQADAVPRLLQMLKTGACTMAG